MFSRSAVGLVLVALLAAACEKVPLLAPSASTISASAPTQSLPPGGSTEITAVVIESGGTPVQNGTLVQFSATLGRVDPAEVETRGGIARTTFTAGNASGVARIRATSGGATGGEEGETAANVVEIAVGAAAATAVTVSASPSRVPSSGGTVTIIASAIDESGNRLVGVPVTFSSTAGSLSASTALTDANGEARVALTTNQQAVVTARVGAAESAPTTVTVGTAGTVSLSVSPPNPLVGSPVSLTITPASGTSPRVVVNWGDGTIEDLGVVAAVRNASHTYQSSGNYIIAATASFDGESFNTSVPVSVGPAGVTLTAPEPPNPTVGTPVSVTVATATPGTSARVVLNWGDGQSTDLGVVSGARSAVHTYTAPGSYVITARATAGNETTETSRAVTVTARPPLSVNVTAVPSSAERCQPVTFTATVPTGETVSTYEWRFVNSSGGEETVTTTGNTLTRIFTTTGTRTVTVRATTPDGRQGSGVTQVVIQPEAMPTSC